MQSRPAAETVPVTEARNNFAEILGQVTYAKKRITIERRGRPLAVLVPIEDLAVLEAGGERAPSESDARLRALIESAPVEFAVKDRDGRYLMVSREFERLNEKTSDEILGLSPEDIYPPETAKEIRRHDEEVLKTEKTIEWEVDVPLQDGMHTYLAAKFPIRDANNRVTGIGGVATDITEQKMAQAALRESEVRFRSLYESIPLSVWEEDWSEVKKIFDRLSGEGISDWQAYFNSHAEVVKRAYDLCNTINLNSTTLQMYREPTKEAALKLVSSKYLTAEEVQNFANWLTAFAAGNSMFVTECEETRNDGTKFAARIRSYVPPEHAQDLARVITTVEDITDRKQTEKALRESEARLRAFVENAPVEVYLKDLESRHIMAGPLTEQFFSRDRADVLGEDIRDLMTKEAAEFHGGHDREVIEAGQPIEKEYEATDNGEIRTFLSLKFPVVDESGTTTAIGAVVTDITDRKQTEKALRDSEAALAQAQRLAKVGNWRWSIEHEELLSCSDEYVRIHGIDPDKIGDTMKNQVELVVHPEDRERVAAVFKRADEEGIDYEIEFRILHPDGGIRHVLEIGQALFDASGKAVEQIGTLQDITERKLAQEALQKAYGELELRVEERTRDLEEVNQTLKLEIAERRQAENALRESEARATTAEQQLLDAIESISEGFIFFDSDEKFVLCNQKYREFYPQISDMLAPGANLEDLVRAAIKHHTSQEGTRTVEERTRCRLEEYRKAQGAHELHLQDGRWLLCSERKTQVGGVVGIRTDITDRKHAEEAVQQSQDRLMDAIESISEGFVLYDTNDRFVLCNQKYRDFYPQISDILVPGATFRDMAWAACERGIFQGAEEDIESWVKNRLTHYRSGNNSLEQQLSDGRWILCSERETTDGGVVGIRSDITERKRAEEELRESEARFRDFAGASADWFWEMDEDIRFTYMSENVERTLGAAPEWYYGKTRQDLLGKSYDREAWDQHLQTLRDHKAFRDFIYYHEGKEQSAWLRASGVPIFADDGSFLGYRGTGSNITAQMEAEEALRESERLFRAIIDNSPATISLKDTEGRYILINKTYRELVGLTEDQVKGARPQDFLDPELADSISELHKTVLESKQTAVAEEHMVIGGETRVFLVIKFPIMDDAGIATGTGSISTDITDMKRAEEALQESQARFAGILDNSAEAIISVDESGLIQLFNQGAEETFGYTAKEMIGQPVEKLLPSEFRDSHSKYIADFLHSSEISRKMNQRGEIFGLRKDRSYFPAEASISKLEFGGQNILTVMLHDITERKEAEEALRGSEQRFRAVVENSPAAILLKGLDGRFRLTNERFRAWFGLRGEELIGKTSYDIYSQEEANAVVAQDREALHGLRVVDREHRFVFADGSEHMVRTTKFPVLDSSGAAIGIGSINIDITESKKIGEELARNEERLRQATQLAGLGHWVWSAIEDRCTFCSEENARIHGLSVQDYIARASSLDGDFSLVHPDDRKEMHAAFTALRGGMGFEKEYRLLTPGGETRHVRETAKPIFDEHGKVTREVGTIQDITKHKQAEETIRTRDAWLRAILENAPIEIVLKDTQECILAISRNVAEQFGLTMDDFIGRKTIDFLPERFAEIYMSADRKVLETGQSIQQNVIEEVGNSTRYYLNSKFPLRDERGQITGICSLTNDITEMKQAEDQLRQSQKMEAVGQLTGGVAHDFNNLLGVIMGNVELLSDTVGTNDKQIQSVIRAANRGAELTQRLLAFSRQQPLQPQAIDLGKLVASMIDLLSRTLGERIEIEVRSAPALSRALADPGQVENALLNLAINARDAMPDGGKLIIETANAAPDAVPDQNSDVADGFVMLAVRDTGCGIPPDKLTHVFEPFFTTKEVGQGSGMGLAMIYGFVQQSNGQVTIESEPDRGTIVRLFLPCAERTTIGEEGNDSGTQLPRGQGEIILVVEDDPAVRQLAVTLLQGLGYDVIPARDATEGARFLDSSASIDLLLADVVLPGGMGGPAFATQARHFRPDLKVLFMSGYAPEVLMEESDLGQDAYLLSKPFRKAELARAVRDTLDGRIVD